MPKAALRTYFMERLREIPAERRHRDSAELRRLLAASPLFQESRVVLMYAELPNEPIILPLLEDGVRGEKVFCLPRVTPQGLILHAVQSAEDLVTLRGSLREPNPDTCPVVEPAEVDLAVIPALAFDPRTGIRLGRGGGYYDRLLARKAFRAFTLGYCFTSQLHTGLPIHPHDIPVRAVLTENGVV
jgi:5-formyltetrahydrofolate cyclo-ligase